MVSRTLLNPVAASIILEVYAAAVPPRKDEGVGWALDEIYDLMAILERLPVNGAVGTPGKEGHIESLVPSKHTRAAVVEGGSASSALTCPIPPVRPRARH